MSHVVGTLDEIYLLIRGKVFIILDEFVGHRGEIVDDGRSGLFSL